MGKHSPLPWSNEQFAGQPCILDATRTVVCDEGNVPNLANREFLVRACNSHDALRAQLQQAQEKLEYNAERHSKHLGGAYRRAEAAERDAEGLRALAEELADAADALQAKLPSGIADDELIRVIHAIRAVRLTPAEAQSPQGGQEEGD